MKKNAFCFAEGYTDDSMECSLKENRSELQFCSFLFGSMEPRYFLDNLLDISLSGSSGVAALIRKDQIKLLDHGLNDLGYKVDDDGKNVVYEVYYEAPEDYLELQSHLARFDPYVQYFEDVPAEIGKR